VTCADDSTWIKARIAKAEALIAAYEDAILAVASGSVQSYTLDTGQTRQTVTKANLTEMRNVVDSLENRRATLRARLGCGQALARPAW